MEKDMHDFIVKILDEAQDLTIATIRPDGYPQATTVSYANDGLDIYVGVGRNSQKVHNIRNSDKVSLTVNKPYREWSQIQGLSMAATARILQDEQELAHAGECMLKRYPEIAQWADAVKQGEVLMLHIRPQVISVLDYSKGFGHTDTVSA